MIKKLVAISLLSASMMCAGIIIAENGFSSKTAVKKVQTTFENVFIDVYNVMSDRPFPSAAQHEAKYEREFHYTVKKIPVDNIQETPVKDIEEIKSPLPLQEYLIQNTPN